MQKYCKSTRRICCARLFSLMNSSIRRIAENSYLADHSQLFAFLSSNRGGQRRASAVAPSLYLCILRKHDCRLFPNNRLCSVIKSTPIRTNLSLHILYIEIQLSVISQTDSFYQKPAFHSRQPPPPDCAAQRRSPAGERNASFSTYPPRTTCAA